MPGNDDEFAIDHALESTTIVNPDNRVVRVDGETRCSRARGRTRRRGTARGRRPRTPCSRACTAWPPSSSPASNTIFNLHCPPYDTQPRPGAAAHADLKVVLDGGEPRIVPVGSRAVRTLIEEVQPVLSLHGHIHESKAVAKIGKTTCVNPGSAYSEGVIDGAVVELRGRKIRSCQLVTG